MNIDKKLKSGSKIFLDGGTGSEIQRLGGAMSPAFSALANINSPEVVINVHENHIKAGCDIITANTFAASRHCLDGIGCGDKTYIVNSTAVKLARQAIKNTDKENKIKIAGSMSNYFALAENEFRPDPKYIPSFAQEEKNYKEVAKILLESGVDILILEMLLDIDHSKILLSAALETGLPVWIGLSCCINKFDNNVIGRNFGAEREKSLVYDDKKYLENPKFLPENKIILLKDIINSLTKLGGDVYGIMHSWIDDAKEGLKILKANWNGPIMLYPEIHLFDTITQEAIITTSEDKFAQSCCELIDDQVQIIGGCCGVSDKHLKKLIERVNL